MLASVCVFAFLCFSITALAVDFYPNFSYRLTNSFLENWNENGDRYPGKFLGATFDNPKTLVMAPFGPYESHQMLQLEPVRKQGTDHVVRIGTVLSDGNGLHMAVARDGNSVEMDTARGNEDIERHWRLADEGREGYFRIISVASGKCLDTYSGAKNDPFLTKCANFSGQFWKLWTP